MTSIRLGFALPVSGSWAKRPNMVRVARRAEELGYASLWSFQRLLHPAEGDWGEMYKAVQDPLVTLAHVAAVTDVVRLGVAVVNMPFYAPIVLAKQLATLDEVSAGRLDVGLGLGWAREEFEAVGASHDRRGARGEEFLRCLTAIWSEDVVAFRGQFYSVPPARVDPKPVQRPHPPLLLGGSAPPALRRAGRLADGWISGSRQDLGRIGADVALVKAAAADVGRDAERLRFVVRGVLRLASSVDDGQDRRLLTGSEEQIRDDLAALAGQGVTEVFIDLNFDPAIGSPSADAAESMRTAEEVLEAFAPTKPEAT